MKKISSHTRLLEDTPLVQGAEVLGTYLAHFESTDPIDRKIGSAERHTLLTEGMARLIDIRIKEQGGLLPLFPPAPSPPAVPTIIQNCNFVKFNCYIIVAQDGASTLPLPRKSPRKTWQRKGLE